MSISSSGCIDVSLSVGSDVSEIPLLRRALFVRFTSTGCKLTVAASRKASEYASKSVKDHKIDRKSATVCRKDLV